MPVPVPLSNKPAAHPVVKKQLCENGQVNPLQNLTRTLPVTPTGPPPSFGTREQWINSLPSWRRTKPRRIWEDDSRGAEQTAKQDFYQGLAVADNASVIKGPRAEACAPPLITLLQPPRSPSTGLTLATDADEDDEMSPASSLGHRHVEQWRIHAAEEMEFEYSGQPPIPSVVDSTDMYCFDQYERGAFTPIFEDQSPDRGSGHEASSSPLGPITPFGQFVDRAVADAQECTLDGLEQHPYPVVVDKYGPPSFQSQSGYQQPVHVVEEPKEPAPAPASEVVTPTATSSYKKLAEPLSAWVANFVWKACTNELALPPSLSPTVDGMTRQYGSSPPSYLSTSVHSLLLSTLLQPSAVFLALWYIVRLPVRFGGIATGGLSVEHVKELNFRAALFGEGHGGADRDALEAGAPFRLVVLGCMLANKWLDDHTFSNKTWHTISNIPIHTLNKLESLALDIFAYDLSISSAKWDQWLAYVMAHHVSLSSPSRPQPISRPSTNPHSIVRKALQEIIQAPVACHFDSSRPQPVFLGLEERRREKLEREQAAALDVLEIDLDEDGPLREEYLPKRRVSGAGSARNSSREQSIPHVLHEMNQNHVQDRRTVEKLLPPPAKWSPAGDEPILRDRNRGSGHYVAVQPTPVNTGPAFQVLPPLYHPSHDYGYSNQQWSTAGAYIPAKPQPPIGYFEFPVLHPSAQPAYNPCPLVLPIALSHSRSHSLSYDQDISQPRNHARSYSQARFDYRHSGISMAANELAPAHEADARWGGHYAYPAASFAPHSNVNYQSAWLRT